MDARALLLELHGRVPPLVEEVVAGLSPDHLTWAPRPGANTIGWLVWHLTRVQDHHLAELLGDAQVLAPWADRFGRPLEPSDTGYGDTPEDVAALRPESADVLLEYQSAVHQRLVAFIDSVTPDGLDRVVDEGWDPPVTLCVRLVSLADDALQHVGQAAYIRGLLP